MAPSDPYQLQVDLMRGRATTLDRRGWLQDGWYFRIEIFAKDENNAYAWVGPYATEEGARRAQETHKHGVIHVI